MTAHTRRGHLARPVRLTASLVLVGALAGVAGPSGSALEHRPPPGPEEAAAAVRGAYRATVGAGSARVRLRATLTADLGGRTEQAEMYGEGGFDFAAKTSQMTIVNPLGLEIDVRTHGVEFCERAPTQLRQRFPGDRTWMCFDFEAADTAQYGGPLYVFAAGPDDPWQVLGFLPAASDVSFVGTQILSGTPTSRYRATVALADVAAIGDTRTRPPRERFHEIVGIDEVPVEVWLDDLGRLRFLQLTVEMRLPGAEWTGTGDPVTATATAGVEFLDYGAEVSVVAPPADQTDDLTDFVSEHGLTAVGEIIGII